MKILIVDNTAESQAFCYRRLESFSQLDKETLDLQVRLANEAEAMQYITEADVLVLGSGLGQSGVVIAKQAMVAVPWLHIIMFVTDELYGGGAFRAAQAVGVRKVFPDSASPIDFLQELVAIHAEFRREGRTREGKVVAIAHAKGGVGATSVAAALAEICSVYNRKTILWDLDVETRDLSRSLTVNGTEAHVVSSWVNGEREISRESLKDALIPISSDVSVLMPPDRMAESMDLICHTDGMLIVQRVVDLARVLYDVILVDTAGRLGPATGALLRAADTVLIVLDDSVLGITALDLYLSFVKSLVGDTDRIVFLVNGATPESLTIEQIAGELEPAHHLGQMPWRLETVPKDYKAGQWPGSGRTMYSLGQKSTRAVLESVAAEIGLCQNPVQYQAPGASQASSAGSVRDEEDSGWLKRLLKR